MVNSNIIPVFSLATQPDVREFGTSRWQLADYSMSTCAAYNLDHMIPVVGWRASNLHRAILLPSDELSAPVQVFGRRHDGTMHALRRPAAEKRQGTKSRNARAVGRATRSAMGISR
jgi:hypothetical protein